MTESERPAPAEREQGGDGSATADPPDTDGEANASPQPLASTGRRRRSFPWRGLTRGTLLVVGCVLAVFSVLIIWVRAELLNTDVYVNTMAPLASSPAVQNAIATDISNQISSKVDIQAKVKDSLPPGAAGLAAPLADQLKSFTYNASKRFVSSDRFQNRWVSINRNAH